MRHVWRKLTKVEPSLAHAFARGWKIFTCKNCGAESYVGHSSVPARGNRFTRFLAERAGTDEWTLSRVGCPGTCEEAAAYLTLTS